MSVAIVLNQNVVSGGGFLHSLLYGSQSVSPRRTATPELPIERRSRRRPVGASVPSGHRASLVDEIKLDLASFATSVRVSVPNLVEPAFTAISLDSEPFSIATDLQSTWTSLSSSLESFATIAPDLEVFTTSFDLEPFTRVTTDLESTWTALSSSLESFATIAPDLEVFTTSLDLEPFTRVTTDLESTWTALSSSLESFRAIATDLASAADSSWPIPAPSAQATNTAAIDVDEPDVAESSAWRDNRVLLLALLDSEPVEDGVPHAVEDLLETALAAWPETVPLRLHETFTEALRETPSIAPDLLKCLGRLDFAKVATIAHRVIREALAHTSTEVREAAVSAVELWKDPDLAECLREHREEVPWLVDYIDLVLADLS